MSDPASRADIRTLARTVAWVWTVARAECAPILRGLVAVTVVRGVVPALGALVVRGLVDVVVEPGPDALARVAPWLAAGFVVALGEALSQFTNHYLSARLSDGLDVRLGTDVLRHARGLDLAFFENPRSRDLIERAQQVNGPGLARLVALTQSTAMSVIQTVTLLAVLVSIEPLVLVAVPPIALPFLLFQWRHAHRRYLESHARATKRRRARYYLGLVTGAYSVAEVRVLRLGALLEARLRAVLEEFRDRNRPLLRRSLVGSSIAASATILVLYALFARVAWKALGGSASIGDLAVFGGTTAALRSSLDQAIRALSGALELTLSVRDLERFLSTRATLRDGDREAPAPPAAALSVRGVTFRYPGAERPVLQDVSFDVAPGETLAIVGENGAGKSTLARLLVRLYDPEAGRILFDGIDVREMRLDELHQRVGFVPQSFQRFEATAAENIAYGDWPALAHDPERIAQVARRAEVDGVLSRLPHGYDTLLGREFGEMDLSGGQWQRVAIARGAARDASLLLLDEPSAALDARAERELFECFRELAAGRTTLLISHRFGTIAIADRILVLSEGRVAELGTHDELLGRDGVYSALYRLQER